MARIILNRAAHFVRDNVSGTLVLSGNVRKDGSLRYTMDNDTTYVLSLKEQELLHRLNFKPRFKNNPK